MENILKTLIHYRQANALLKYNNVKELECVINKLSKILAKKKSRELVLIEEQKKKADKLAVYQEVLAANGIDINELMTLVTQTAKAAKTAK
jgi:DNA-binding protein H-NS